MAKHGWVASIGLSVGTAAAAAATQFGLGYGLGIIAWAPGNPSISTDDAWLASLAWTTFIAATSTVVGAVYADRRSASSMGLVAARGQAGERVVPPGALAVAAWRTLLAFCAAIGALISVAMVLIPAQSAVDPDVSSPELVAAGYAVVGIVLGIVIGACALASRAAATNVIATAAVLWLFAVVAVVDAQAVEHGARATPLASWPFGPGTYFKATWSIEGTALMFGSALVIGAGAAWWAARRTESRVGVALSGAVGPLMTATAYLFSTPHLVGVDSNPQLSAYLVAPYAVIAGLVGSMIAVAGVTAMENNRNRRKLATDTPVPVTQAILPTPRSSTPSWLSGLDEDTPTGCTPSGSTPGSSTTGGKKGAEPKLPPGGLASGVTGTGVTTSTDTGPGSGSPSGATDDETTAKLRPVSRGRGRRS